MPDAPLDSLPAVLTVEETGRYLRIGRAAAYAAVRAGDIPAIRLGRSIRVPRAALLALLCESPAAESAGHEQHTEPARERRDEHGGDGGCDEAKSSVYGGKTSTSTRDAPQLPRH